MQTIESPCRKLCRLDAGIGLCTGCGRSLAEIGDWLTFTQAKRRSVIADSAARLAKMAAAERT